MCQCVVVCVGVGWGVFVWCVLVCCELVCVVGVGMSWVRVDVCRCVVTGLTARAQERISAHICSSSGPLRWVPTHMP